METEYDKNGGLKKIRIVREIGDVVEAGSVFWHRLRKEKRIFTMIFYDDVCGSFTDNDLHKLDVFFKGEVWEVTLRKLDKEEIEKERKNEGES